MLLLKSFDLSSNIMKLLVPIGMLLALLGLAIALQTVAHFPQHGVDRHCTDLIPLPLKGCCQLIDAFTRPTQGVFWCSTTARFDQLIQCLWDLGLLYFYAFASTSSFTNVLVQKSYATYFCKAPKRWELSLSLHLFWAANFWTVAYGSAILSSGRE